MGRLIVLYRRGVGAYLFYEAALCVPLTYLVARVLYIYI